MSRTALAAALAAASALAPTISVAMASRPRWKTADRIPFWIEKNPRRAHEREMVRRAFQAWSAVSQGTVVFREVDEFPPTGIRVRFGASEERFGEAIPYADEETGRITRADVLLSANIDGDPLQRQVVTYLTALHEVGHALGLEHTRRFEAAMYQFRQAGDPDRYFMGYRSRTPSPEAIGTAAANGLSTGDVNALRRLYCP
jgi:hypothetical protein